MGNHNSKRIQLPNKRSFISSSIRRSDSTRKNVEQVLALQSGLIPPNPKAQPPLDLANSETLKALMEEDVQKHSGMKEYRPAPVKVSPVNPAFKVNTLGKSHENIQQSYSFKRLMADVLGETDF